MSWQDELRRIDSDFAAGKLSKDQYALKREDVLARASSATDAPPFATETATTRVPAEELMHTERTTSAPSPADDQPTDSIPHPARPSQTTPAPSAMEPGEIPPPVPPTTEESRAAAPTPEPFPEPVPRGTGPTLTFLALGVVLVVALVAAGLWWLASGETDRVAGANPPSAGTTAPTTKSAAPPPTSSTPSDDEMAALPDLPGVLHSGSGSHPVAKVETLYSPGMAKVLKKHGIRTVQWKASMRETARGQMTYVLVVANAGDETKAAKVTNALQKLGRKHAQPAAWAAPGYDLPTFQQRADGTALNFIVYQSGVKAVHVNLLEDPPQQRGATQNTLMNLLTDVMSTLVPS